MDTRYRLGREGLKLMTEAGARGICFYYQQLDGLSTTYYFNKDEEEVGHVLWDMLKSGYGVQVFPNPRRWGSNIPILSPITNQLETAAPTQVNPAAFDPTKPVQTRDGRAARIICSDREYRGHVGVFVALVTSTNGHEHLTTHGVAGNCTSLNGYSTAKIVEDCDLINVPEEPIEYTGYVNIYPSNIMGARYLTREGADERCSSSRIACIPITFTEGEGLSDD